MITVFRCLEILFKCLQAGFQSKFYHETQTVNLLLECLVFWTVLTQNFRVVDPWRKESVTSVNVRANKNTSFWLNCCWVSADCQFCQINYFHSHRIGGESTTWNSCFSIMAWKANLLDECQQQELKKWKNNQRMTASAYNFAKQNEPFNTDCFGFM